MISVASLFSVGVLLVVFYFFVRNNRDDKLAVAALLFKVIAGISLGLIYKFYYEGGDTFQYFKDAGVLANYMIERPSGTFAIFLHTADIPEIAGQIAYSDQPRALFFTRIITVFYLITGGNYWLISIFLSVISFFGAYILVKELSRNYAGLSIPAKISFYFLPSFVFWTSGLLKESVAVSALLVLVAMCLKMKRQHKFLNIYYWIALAFAGFILWELKYFYAALTFPVLFSLLIFEYINGLRKLPAYYLLFFFIVGIAVVSQLHYNLSFTHIADVVYQNYRLGVDNSDSAVLRYLNFDGSVKSYVMNLPLAMIFGLFRPVVFESANIMQLLVGLENTVVLVLFLMALWKSRKSIRVPGHHALAALIYVISLDVFLAFSTPNFGTLSRYKVGFWPFFVLFVLIGLRQKKSDLNKG
jgi:hypothetical protein